MKYLVRSATLKDGQRGHSLRDADLAEIKASGVDCPIDCLTESIRMSHRSHVIEVDGTPHYFSGVTKDGVVWAMTTKEMIYDYREIFKDETKKILMSYLDEFKFLYNIIYSKNKVHIRWLKSMGFTIAEEHMLGEHKFYRFYMERL